MQAVLLLLGKSTEGLHQPNVTAKGLIWQKKASQPRQRWLMVAHGPNWPHGYKKCLRQAVALCSSTTSKLKKSQVLECHELKFLLNTSGFQTPQIWKRPSLRSGHKAEKKLLHTCAGYTKKLINLFSICEEKVVNKQACLKASDTLRCGSAGS